MNRDFVEMLAALSAAGAEFLVVGAYAMAAYGLPRATGDIDIWPNRLTLTIDDQVIPVIGRAELVRNKAATGRPKDQADVIWLRERTRS